MLARLSVFCSFYQLSATSPGLRGLYWISAGPSAKGRCTLPFKRRSRSRGKADAIVGDFASASWLCEAFRSSTVFKHFEGFAEAVRRTAKATEAVEDAQKGLELALGGLKEAFQASSTLDHRFQTQAVKKAEDQVRAAEEALTAAEEQCSRADIFVPLAAPRLPHSPCG